MTFKLSKRSLERMEGVHPDLIKCVKRAIELTKLDFTVLEGVRSLERQKMLLEKGTTDTLNSRHFIQPDGYGHAVDLAPLPISWAEEDKYRFRIVADAMHQAAKELGLKIIWGGNWGKYKDDDVRDGPHFQLMGK